MLTRMISFDKKDSDMLWYAVESLNNLILDGVDLNKALKQVKKDYRLSIDGTEKLLQLYNTQ